MMVLFLIVTKWGLTGFTFCTKGVTKAVAHINDTLGPALIQSVSTSAQFSFVYCTQHKFTTNSNLKVLSVVSEML